MARHEIVIHENTGATKVGSYIAKETLQIPAFAAAIGNKCGLPAIQVIAILTGSFEAIQALERESLVRAWTDIGVVCAVITGSFPTADAAFDPARNALELALRLDETLRLDLTDTVPVIVTDADITKLRVDNAMDLEVENPMNLIHGRHVFRVAGLNMVLTGDPDAKAYLKNVLGTTFPLVIDEVVSKQLFRAHTAELLPGGDYRLVVESHAGDAAGPLQTSFRKVKYLRVEDPVPETTPVVTSIVSTAAGAIPGQLIKGEEVMISGRNFGYDGSELSVKFTREDGVEVWGSVHEMTDVYLKSEWPTGLDDVLDNSEVTVTVTRHSGGEDHTSSPVTVTVVSI